MILNPNCSESVVRLDFGKLISYRAKELIIEHFKDTKAFYEEETDGDDWYSYLLKYMKLDDKKVIYCSRFEGEDDFFLDLIPIEYLYEKEDLIDAQAKGIKLSLTIKGKKR